MNFLELAKKRNSVRKYTEQVISEEHVQQILEAGRVAPTAANKQPYHIIAVRSEEGLLKIAKTGNVYGAPLALIVCAEDNESWVRPFDGKNLADIDATIVTTHMMMEAAQLELGSLWVCYFDPSIIKQEFALPDGLAALHILAVGHPNEKPLSPDRHDKTRKSIEKTVTFA